MSTKKQNYFDLIIPLIAEAYKNSVLSGINIKTAMESLELIREALTSGMDFPDLFKIIDSQTGTVSDKRLKILLAEFHQQVKRIFLKSESEIISDKLNRDKEEGWNYWLLIYVQTLNKWRLEFCNDLLNEPLPFTAEQKDEIERQKDEIINKEVQTWQKMVNII